MFGQKTINGILKNFNQNITDLRAIAEASDQQLTKINDKIMELKVETADAAMEKTKATNIADKLENLISGE